MVASVKRQVFGTTNQTADFLQKFNPQPGDEYEITVVASNVIGNSSESNPVLFTAPTNSSAMADFDPLLYIPVIVSAVVIGIVVLLVVVFITGYLYRSKFVILVCT